MQVHNSSTVLELVKFLSTNAFFTAFITHCGVATTPHTAVHHPLSLCVKLLQSRALWPFESCQPRMFLSHYSATWYSLAAVPWHLEQLLVMVWKDLRTHPGVFTYSDWLLTAQVEAEWVSNRLVSVGYITSCKSTPDFLCTTSALI